MAKFIKLKAIKDFYEKETMNLIKIDEEFEVTEKRYEEMKENSLFSEYIVEVKSEKVKNKVV